MTAQRRRLILFTRFPQVGRVKTRLIPALGPEGATALHRRLVLCALRTAQAAAQLCGAQLEIRFDRGSAESMHHWLGDDLFCRAQAEGDLGERMQQAFKESFQEGAESTIVIGSDCPALSPALLRDGFENLAHQPVVLGPATDGGYYLIGLTRHIPQLFRGITWGSDRVLNETVRILSDLKLTPALLTALDDIDRPEDLAAWNRCIGPVDADLHPVSVIIPALNEAQNIVATIDSVRQGNPLEILVVDGRSTDQTAELAQKVGATILCSNPGRARQMNAGAAAAAGSVLLFLHADTTLRPGWTDEVASVLQRPRVAAGAFAFALNEDFAGKRILEAAVNWRARRFQMPYGDQALFMRRALFEELGGFANLPILEDYELVHRLRRLRGRIITSSLPAVTSGRRWRKSGLLRVTLKNQLLLAGFWAGVSPHTLARLYRGSHNPTGM